MPRLAATSARAHGRRHLFQGRGLSKAPMTIGGSAAVTSPAPRCPRSMTAKWPRVDLPHDWSAEGPFSADFGSGNGYAPGGIAWYRKHFTVPAALKDKIGADRIRRRLRLRRSLGQRTLRRRPALRLLELRVSADAVREIRRHGQRRRRARRPLAICRFALVHRLRHLPARPPALHRPAPYRALGHVGDHAEVTASSATVTVETTIDNASAATRDLSLESEVVLRGTVVARSALSRTIDGRGRQTLVQNIAVARPERWSTESPTL